MRRVIVHVDRLVLRGVPAEQRHAIAEGLQRELRRVFTEIGLVERNSVRKEAEAIPRFASLAAIGGQRSSPLIYE